MKNKKIDDNVHRCEKIDFVILILAAKMTLWHEASIININRQTIADISISLF